MPSERFYLDADLSSGTLCLQGAEFHHLAHVMRIRVGEEIELVNGRGALATARVTALSKQVATVVLLSVSQTPLPKPHLLLAVALMRPSKLEELIEKCTELGADAFWLYPAQHSDRRDLSLHQWERLTHIAIAAMKQCGRLDLPPLKMFARLEDLFDAPYSYFFGDTRPQAKTIPPPILSPLELCEFLDSARQSTIEAQRSAGQSRSQPKFTQLKGGAV